MSTIIAPAQDEGLGAVDLDKNTKIYVAGHTGMVGSALVRQLKHKGYHNIVTRGYPELDLMEQEATRAFFKTEKPEVVILAAAKVGGIHANNVYRADFIYQNIMIQSNIIDAAFRNGVQKLLFLGSSCIYPRDCPQPIKEEYLLTGPLEATNEPYALAKIVGVKMCESYNRQYGTNYLSVMPTNLYGPNDNYDPNNSHVLPALIRKAHETKKNNQSTLSVWGSGKPRREFLYVDDLADACVFLLEGDIKGDLFNIGCGTDLTIAELAEVVMKVVGLNASIQLDSSKPDGTPQKLLDVSKLAALGWVSHTSLEEGIALAYDDFLKRFG